MTLAQFIYVWLMSAVVIAMPTGLVVMWALCRTPSWNRPSSKTLQAADAANDAPTTVVAKAA